MVTGAHVQLREQRLKQSGFYSGFYSGVTRPPSTVGSAEDLRGHTPTCSFYRENHGPIKSKVTPGFKAFSDRPAFGRGIREGQGLEERSPGGRVGFACKGSGEPGRDSTSRASGGGGDGLSPQQCLGLLVAPRSERHRHTGWGFGAPGSERSWEAGSRDAVSASISGRMAGWGGEKPRISSLPWVGGAQLSVHLAMHRAPPGPAPHVLVWSGPALIRTPQASVPVGPPLSPVSRGLCIRMWPLGQKTGIQTRGSARVPPCV